MRGEEASCEEIAGGGVTKNEVESDRRGKDFWGG